ncbi:DNA-binding transcriptional regulator [Microtetraspora sp. NBRC 13810]|uniref:helix-turn-helix transcriptional regulator n=1 Tax=Microtetraspora sp. NBRC 13810 TaxID=3030990 RepID=UPI0024A4B05C|nr:YafY family protein [Microtetraspora sp. NBRC 13810]GLW12761.1 DNA-binding transcriptional regulator [Microtetraspora sp. NBRC 13810]
MVETSARLLRLLSLLQVRRDWPGAELAARLGVTPRTIRRDVERLRGLGYPVHASAGVTGYRLGAGSELPPLLLDDEEAVAVAVGLRTAAGGTVTGIAESSVRALAKLERVLPARLRHRVRALGSMTVPLPAAGPAVPPETLTAIAGACRDHESLRFDYRAHDGGRSTRLVEPYRLVATGRRWYLVAYDPAKPGWRTFRLDRLSLRTPNGPRFTPREPPGPDLAAYVSRGLSGAPYRYRGRFTVHAPAAEVAERMPATVAVVEPLGAGTCALTAGSDSLDELALWVALLGVRFEAHEPPELVAHLRALAGRLTAAADAGS